MFRRHPITVLVAVTIAVGSAAASIGARTACAQTPDSLSRAGDAFYELPSDDFPRGSQPWVGWHGPLDDGLLGLRFGMDRFAVSRILRERDLEGRPSRPQTQRFEGSILGHPGEVLTEYRPDPHAPTGERLSRIQIMWRIDGLPNRAVELFGKLEGMLASRYGEPLLAEDDGYAALDNGWGKNRRGFVGTQAKALLEVEAVRSQRFRVVISLESPQLHVAPRVDDGEG